MGYEALELEIADHVANVRLTRPEVLNRFDETLHRESADVLSRLSGDPERRSEPGVDGVGQRHQQLRVCGEQREPLHLRLGDKECVEGVLVR
jgi:hypothetical protein